MMGGRHSSVSKSSSCSVFWPLAYLFVWLMGYIGDLQWYILLILSVDCYRPGDTVIHTIYMPIMGIKLSLVNMSHVVIIAPLD